MNTEAHSHRPGRAATSNLGPCALHLVAGQAQRCRFNSPTAVAMLVQQAQVGPVIKELMFASVFKAHYTFLLESVSSKPCIHASCQNVYINIINLNS